MIQDRVVVLKPILKTWGSNLAFSGHDAPFFTLIATPGWPDLYIFQV